MAIQAYTGNFGAKEITHLFKRCLFGVKRSEITANLGKTLTEVVDILLLDVAPPNPPINNYNDNNYTDPEIPAGLTWVTAKYDNDANFRRIYSLKAWWVALMVNQNVSLKEKMTLFWHNHFSTETDTVDDSRYLYKHNALLRSFAFGNFKAMIKGVTLDPAMLVYLNGYINTKTAPDENYGRELQELFTVGKGPNSSYTEADVKATARLLTGFRVSRDNINSFFDATRHDTTNKQFSAFYGNKLINGRTGVDGAKELDDLIDMIFAQNELSMYICRRLYRFFVYYDISPTTELEVITPLAEIFRANNYDIKPVLKALFTSNHFFLAQNRSCNIKSPIDYVVGLAREYEIAFPAASDYLSHYYMCKYLRETAANFQQDICDPPNVSGWAAYYQNPQYYELWINSDTLPKRNAFTDRFIANGYTANAKTIVINSLDYTNKFIKPEDPNQLITEALSHLFTIDVNDEVKRFLKSILLSGQADDKYWTDAWLAYKASPNDNTRTNIVTTRLKAFYKYIMNLEEYHLS